MPAVVVSTRAPFTYQSEAHPTAHSNLQQQQQPQQQQSHPPQQQHSQQQRRRAPWAPPIGIGLLLARLARSGVGWLLAPAGGDISNGFSSCLSDVRVFPSLVRC